METNLITWNHFGLNPFNICVCVLFFISSYLVCKTATPHHTVAIGQIRSSRWLLKGSNVAIFHSLHLLNIYLVSVSLSVGELFEVSFEIWSGLEQFKRSQAPLTSTKGDGFYPIFLFKSMLILTIEWKSAHCPFYFPLQFVCDGIYSIYWSQNLKKKK